MKQDLAHLVELAIQDNPALEGLELAVEKEILHYDILHGLMKGEYLHKLALIGGAALRLCHGARRFSENLDFDGGAGFDIAQLPGADSYLQRYLSDRHGGATVSPPKRLIKDGDRALGIWRISIMIQSGKQDMPRRPIHLDIADVPGHDASPMRLKRSYPTLPDGFSDMVIRARNKDGILADKLAALPGALGQRDPRLQDLWDIDWLARNGAGVDPGLVRDRIKAQHVEDYADRLADASPRVPELIESDGFVRQLSRSLDRKSAAATVFRPKWRECVARDLQDLLDGLLSSLK